jgi:hypothetical protein
MRRRAGISQRTVCQALGLHPSELSVWENQRRGIRLNSRSMRYARFLAGLRRAEINQAAAAVLLADDEMHGQTAGTVDDSCGVRVGAPAGPGRMGAAGGGGAGLLLRGRVRLSGWPVDTARPGGGQAGRLVASGPHRGPVRVQGPGACGLQPVRGGPARQPERPPEEAAGPAAAGGPAGLVSDPVLVVPCRAGYATVKCGCQGASCCSAGNAGDPSRFRIPGVLVPSMRDLASHLVVWPAGRSRLPPAPAGRPAAHTRGLPFLHGRLGFTTH